MSVDDSSEVDIASLDSVLKHRGNPSRYQYVKFIDFRQDLLRRVRRINDHSIFALIIDNQIRIVVTTPHP